MLVRRLEESSCLRLHPQQLEVIAGDRIARNPSGRIAPAQSRAGISIISGDAAEDGVASSKVFKRRVRRRQKFKACPRLEAKLIQVLRVSHLQRFQQYGIQY